MLHYLYNSGTQKYRKFSTAAVWKELLRMKDAIVKSADNKAEENNDITDDNEESEDDYVAFNIKQKIRQQPGPCQSIG